MIEDTPIVNDTRKVRKLISQHFAHDIDRYLDYLCTQTQEASPKIAVKKKVRTRIRTGSRRRVARTTT